LLHFGTAAFQNSKSGQILTYLTPVKFGWAACRRQSKGQSSLPKVEVFNLRWIPPFWNQNASKRTVSQQTKFGTFAPSPGKFR